MTLITSAKYVNPELEAEFGKIPPAFLPLGGRRLYEHQVELLNSVGEDIALSIPESFEITSADSKKLKQIGLKIIRVPDGLLLGESIIYALNMLLPISESIKILHGDTFFSSLLDTIRKDSLVVSSVENSYDWTYLITNDEPLFQIKDFKKLDQVENLIVSGFFSFTNVYELIKCIVKADYSFIKGIALYSKTYNLSAIYNNTWLDFGLASSYYHSRKSMTTERVFNNLIIENGYVTKCSKKVNKLAAEINWFQHFPDELALYIPRFRIASDGYSCYQTEYLYLSTLSELYVFGKLPEYVWKQIFTSTKIFLNKLHMDKVEIVNSSFDYKEKTLERLDLFSKESEVCLEKEWIFNGNMLPSISKIIGELDSYLANRDKSFSFIHGDICFSNIMYDFRANQIKVFDPRGMDFKDNISVYGDPSYDHAKMMHSVIGLYDFIISGFYNCEVKDHAINFHIDITEEVKKIQQTYLDVFGKEKYEMLYAVMVHLFLSMLPLHNDNEQKQYALLANAFRLYTNLKEGL